MLILNELIGIKPFLPYVYKSPFLFSECFNQSHFCLKWWLISTKTFTWRSLSLVAWHLPSSSQSYFPHTVPFLSTALNRTKMMVIESAGCIASHLCNQIEWGSVFTLSYTKTKTCCNTDFCNGASSVRLPFAAALGAALVAIWTTWGL